MSLNSSTDPSFVFKQRAGRINWRQIQSLDLPRIIETGDVVSLQSVLENITYASLDRDDLERFSDASLVKLFKLSQLSIEYLMHAQSKLYNQAQTLDSQYKEHSSKAAALEDSVKTKEKELVEMKREVQNKRKTLATYEFLLKQPQTAGALAAKPASFRCSHCSKHFLNQAYLDSHINRRHSQPDESVKSRETLAMMEMIQTLVTHNIKAMAESHSREVETLKSTFERQILGLQKSQEQIEMQRSQSMDSQRASPAKEDAIRDFFIQQRQQESAHLMKVIDDQKLLIAQLTKQIADTNERLTLKSEEAAKALALKGFAEEQAKAQAQLNAAQELLKQKEMWEIERRALEAKAAAPAPEQRVSTPPPTPVIVAETSLRPRAPPPRLTSNAEELELDLPSPKASRVVSNAGELELDVSEEPVDTSNIPVLVAEPVEAPNKKDPELAEVDEEVMAFQGRRTQLGAEKGDSADYEEISSDLKGISTEDAAKTLGIEESELMYIAAEFLQAPLPAIWEQRSEHGQVCYYNTKTHFITYSNPNLDTYIQKYIEAKAELYKTYSELTSRLRMLMEEPRSSVLAERYIEGIATHFQHSSDSFGPAKGLMKKSFEGAKEELEKASRTSQVPASVMGEFADVRARLIDEGRPLKREFSFDEPSTPVSTPLTAMARSGALDTSDEALYKDVSSPVFNPSVSSTSTFARAVSPLLPTSSDAPSLPPRNSEVLSSSHRNEEPTALERFYIDQSEETLEIEAELNDIQPPASSVIARQRRAIGQYYIMKKPLAADPSVIVVEGKPASLTPLPRKGW